MANKKPAKAAPAKSTGGSKPNRRSKTSGTPRPKKLQIHRREYGLGYTMHKANPKWSGDQPKPSDDSRRRGGSLDTSREPPHIHEFIC